MGSYNGLAGIWGRGLLPKIIIPKESGRSFIIPSRPDYYAYPYGRPYIGQRPPPPLFTETEWGKAEPMFTTFLKQPLKAEFQPRPRIRAHYPQATFQLED